MMNPIPIFCTLQAYTPYMHTHMLFSRFCTLFCALVTVDTAHTIYFVLIHHCTNSRVKDLPKVLARVGFEPATFRTQGTEPTTEPPRPHFLVVVGRVSEYFP